MALAKIISIDKKKLIVTEAIYLIKEFRELWEETKEDKYFVYIWSLYDPESPYMNYPESDRSDLIERDIGKVDFTNELFQLAIKRAQESYFTPERKLLDGAKANIEYIASYLKNTKPTDGRDGNIAQMQALQKNLPIILRNYQAVEGEYRQTLTAARGKRRQGLGED